MLKWESWFQTICFDRGKKIVFILTKNLQENMNFDKPVTV
jgi:hypothetical protein